MTSKSRADVFISDTTFGTAEAEAVIDAEAPKAAAAGDAALDPAQILVSIGEVPYRWRIDTDRLAWGPNVADVLKVGADAIANGSAFAALVGDKSAETRSAAIMRSGRRDEGAGVPYTVQYCLRTGAAADELWVEDSGRWFADADGRPERAHGVVRVINGRHQQEQRLADLCRFDALTGELNRSHLLSLLADTLEDAVRFRTSCGFLLVAIDDLDQLNDSYGFDIADEVIAAVGQRIRVSLRGGDGIGRFSSNRFGVVLKNCSADDLRIAADRFSAGIRDETVRTTAGPAAVTVTVGGVIAPRHARTIDDIVARAEEAVGGAKTRRRNSFQAYRPSIERDALRRENVRATDEIVAALNERRITPVFEPVARSDTRKIAFFECLMRLQRPDGSLLPAQDVVPVAERLGLVRLLDHRVMELVVNALMAAPDLRLSLNVSTRSATDADWWNALEANLRLRTGIAERLIVEITETAAIHDETGGFVGAVKDLGCRIAIDDFGAGYTSFRNLRKLGVDLVKIDGSFVQNLSASADDRAYAHTLIDLARRLGLETVAEWVQDEAAAAMLAGWGCDYLQGTLVGLASAERPGLESRQVDCA